MPRSRRSWRARTQRARWSIKHRDERRTSHQRRALFDRRKTIAQFPIIGKIFSNLWVSARPGTPSAPRPRNGRPVILNYSTPANVKGFGRRPITDGGAGFGAGVRKPSTEETAGRKGAGWAVTTYGDLKVAAGAPGEVRGPGGRVIAEGGEDRGALGCEDGLVWRGRFGWRRAAEPARRSACCSGAAGGEEKRRCGAGSTAKVMRCRS